MLGGGVLLGLFFSLCLDAVDLVFVDGVEGAVGRNGDAAGVDGLADFAVAGQSVEEILGVPLHVRELGQAGVQVGVVNGGWVELLVKPFLETDGADSFKIAGTGAESEAIKGVEDAVVALELGGLVVWARCGLRGLLCVPHREAKGAAKREGQRAREGFHCRCSKT